MKHSGVLLLLLLFFSCHDRSRPETAAMGDTLVATQESKAAAPRQVMEPPSEPVAPEQPVPQGYYRTLFSDKPGSKIEQIVYFRPNRSYRLQERYLDAGDSTVVTEGTWAPSNGLIWLYRDQIVRGRYQWKGKVLHYFNPANKERYPMQKATDAAQSEAAIQPVKSRQLLGTGTEPFWSLEWTATDSLVFQLADWNAPLRFKRMATFTEGDTIIYQGAADSLAITLKVLPYFCSDGMSDRLYSQKLLVFFKDQRYSGCGERPMRF